ncbi:Subtilisin [Desulfotomaculum nigrificans CO-1-SRB]|uniref:Subtilisin n=1 Tax=Desulfotomaculum nigrificans (strain DSM 14880 / VKM B-2319 / CO-1-SRB) TaxID=868595 RepID=F6B4F9_DESCC|nr:S8 family peptidase [Desulfotomaculum nigrificans]AEF92982.1 Subtilisin [Desulfotomaculum nigrificans CO-1-SRB]
MAGITTRQRIILFKARLHRGELTPPHINLINWVGAQEVLPLPSVNGVVCSLPADISDEEILATGAVTAVEENVRVRLVPWTPVKFSPFWSEQDQLIPWGVHYIGAAQCWGGTRGRHIKVAVVDTGIDGNHPDIQANLKGGINFVNPGTSYFDDNGHGTHVAGTIAAVDNGSGIIGVAPEASLYAVKVLDHRGDGNVLNVIYALQWCLQNKIDIVNMSFGTDSYSRALEEAVKTARRNGLLMVTAAGNDSGPNTVDYPAVFHETISAAAVDGRGQLAGFSSSGPEVDLLAPGANIISTYRWGTYTRLNGSSMAAAHISGAAALVKAKYPEEDVDLLHRRLVSGATPLKGPDKGMTGAGIIRVDNSI